MKIINPDTSVITPTCSLQCNTPAHMPKNNLQSSVLFKVNCGLKEKSLRDLSYSLNLLEPCPFGLFMYLMPDAIFCFVFFFNIYYSASSTPVKTGRNNYREEVGSLQLCKGTLIMT